MTTESPPNTHHCFLLLRLDPSLCFLLWESCVCLYAYIKSHLFSEGFVDALNRRHLFLLGSQSLSFHKHMWSPRCQRQSQEVGRRKEPERAAGLRSNAGSRQQVNKQE